jgi:gas vesicle protein
MMDRCFRFAAGALVGATVSVALVVLFTPQSGAELQEAIRDRIEALRAAGQDAAETRRLELTAQLEALKQPKGQA